jgi:tripartite-type tricarboxylate transporter receptor subunit TctC
MNNIRSTYFPNVPLVTDVGYQGPPSRSWYGIFAPAGIPRSIVGHFSA